MTKDEELQYLLEDQAKLNQKFDPLLRDLALDEWFEVITTDRIAQVKRENERLSSHIYYAEQIIARRVK